MFDISTITVDDLMERTALLSDSLSTVADSPEYLEAVSKICDVQKITDTEQIASVQQVVGLVLLGFIRPGDLGNEINQLVGLNNPAIATAIAQAVQKEIFAPISAELERNYRPVAGSTSSPQAIGRGIPVMPRSIDGIRPPVAMPNTPTTNNLQPATAPVVISIAKPVVTPAPASAPAITRPTGQSSGQASSAPAPFVIHKETSAVPVQPKATFKIEVPQKSEPLAISKQPLGSAPARIEFGKGTSPAPAPKPTVVKTESEAPRMVRYVQSAKPETRPTGQSSGQASSGPVSLSSIGITPAKTPAPRPSLNIALEKPTMPMVPPPRPPGR